MGLETGKHRRESAFAGAEPRCASVAGLCPRTPSAVGSGDTTTLPTLPCQTAAWTAEPPGAEPWGPPQGSLIPLCLFQKEANLLLCQAALAQSRRGEKRERVGSVTEKGHDESHPLPGRASPDATRLISSPEVWPASHRGAAAPGRSPRGLQARLLPHPLRGGWSGQAGVSPAPDAMWLCWLLCVASGVMIQELRWCGNQDKSSSSYNDRVTR